MSPFIDHEQFRNLLYSWPEKAIQYLYNHIYDDLLRIADMHTHNRAVSEDVLQEVFADVCRKHREIGLPRGESIHTYLVRAVTNHAITHYRRNARTAKRETEYFYSRETSEDQSAADNIIASKEKQSFLRLVVGTLPPRQKACMLLRIDHGMHVKDIARQLGITVKAVEWNLRSARKRLKKFRTQIP